MNLSDMTLPQFKIDKHIRLIELFAGIGSQAMALRDLDVEFEHYRAIELDKFAIKSYNAIHDTDFETTDICNINGTDLGICDTDKFCYIMTYSFPCQDLSVAGKQKGMTKGSGTRSGLLWEVERILNECSELPQVLLMENVPQVHGKKNMLDFQKWIDFLESKGYSNYWQDLNAKDYGVAQNRNRCFMVSILGEWSYKFPEPIPLEKTMKDYLEDDVDEKYYINTEKAQKLIRQLIRNGTLKGDNAEKIPVDFSIKNPQEKVTSNCITSKDYSISKKQSLGNGVVEWKKDDYGFDGGNYAGNVHDKEKLSPTIRTFKEGNQQPVIVAMRGRNPDNPSDRTAGSPTEQRLEPNSQGICNTLTSIQKDNMVLEKEGVEDEERIIEILQILRKENGEKAFFEWAIRGLWCILAEEILQQGMYAKIVFERWVNTTDIFQCAYDSKAYKFSDITEEQVRDMWEGWKIGCSSQGRKLSEQQSREFNDFVQKLPFETAQKQRYVYCLWESSQGIRLLQQTLLEVQKIWESDGCKHGARSFYRIRKLNPKEVWRLMDFSDEDFHKAEEVNSNTQLYKQAGNAICRNVLVAILGQLIEGKENYYKEGDKNVSDK